MTALHYADTSAWLKLVHDEAESEAMLDHLDAVRALGGRFVASRLLLTELQRAAVRLEASPDASPAPRCGPSTHSTWPRPSRRAPTRS